MTLAEKNIQKIINPNLSYLRIGCTSNAELGFLQEMLCALPETYPRVYPQIFIHDYYAMKNLFVNKQLDMFLATREMIKDIDDCSFRKLKTISSYAIVSEKSHPLPKFIPFQNGNRLQEKILLHSQSHFNLMCENDQAAILLARCRYGAAILPEFFIPAQIDDLIVIPLTDEEDVMDYGIAYHKNTNTEYIRFLIHNFCFPVLFP